MPSDALVAEIRKERDDLLGNVSVPVQTQLDDLNTDIEKLGLRIGGLSGASSDDPTVNKYYSQKNITQNINQGEDFDVRNFAIANEYIQKGVAVGQDTITKRGYKWTSDDPMYEYIGICIDNTDENDRVACQYIGEYNFNNSSLQASKNVYIDSEGNISHESEGDTWARIGSGTGAGVVMLSGVAGFSNAKFKKIQTEHVTALNSNGLKLTEDSETYGFHIVDTTGLIAAGLISHTPDRMFHLYNTGGDENTNPIIKCEWSTASVGSKGGFNVAENGTFLGSLRGFSASYIDADIGADLQSDMGLRALNEIHFVTYDSGAYAVRGTVTKPGGLEWYYNVKVMNGKLLKMYDTGSSHAFSFVAPALTSNTTMILPDDDAAAANQALMSDGAGNFGWLQPLGPTDSPTFVTVTATTFTDSTWSVTGGAHTGFASMANGGNPILSGDIIEIDGGDSFLSRSSATKWVEFGWGVGGVRLESDAVATLRLDNKSVGGDVAFRASKVSANDTTWFTYDTSAILATFAGRVDMPIIGNGGSEVAAPDGFTLPETIKIILNSDQGGDSYITTSRTSAVDKIDFYAGGLFNARFDNTNGIYLATNIRIPDEVRLQFGSAFDVRLTYSTSQASHTMVWGLDDAHGNSIIYTTDTNRNKNHDHAGQTNPTSFWHSMTNPDSANDEWVSVAHDVTNAVFGLGSGKYTFPDGDMDLGGNNLNNALSIDNGGTPVVSTDGFSYADSIKNIYGTGSDVETYYDGEFFRIVTDIVAPSDVVIDCGPSKTVELAEAVFEDQQVNINAVGFGSSAPTVTDYKGGKVLAFNKSQDNKITFTAQLSHKYKSGSTISFHVHVTTAVAGAGDVVWIVTTSLSDIGDDFPNETSATDTQEVAADSDDLHMFFVVDADIGVTSDTPSACIICSLTREGSNEDDTFDDDIYLVSLDFHIEETRMGSRTATAF